MKVKGAKLVLPWKDQLAVIHTEITGYQPPSTVI